MAFRLPRALSRHPIAAVFIAGLFVGAAGAVGMYAYGVYQWRAAREAIEAERFAEARGCLKYCLLVWPESTPVHVLAARAARLNGDFPAAEAHLNQCLKNRGADEAVRLEFLLMRAQSGEADEVSAELSRFVEDKHKDTPVILETLARSYMQRLHYGAAYALLGRWIEEAPNSVKPYHWRGWVLERMDNPGGAMKDYLRVLEIDPNQAAARLRIAEMLLEDYKSAEALPHLEQLYRAHPNRPDVMARLGQCLMQLGKMTEARKLLEAAVVSLPEDASLLISLSRLELDAKRPDKAEKLLRDVLKLDPADTEAQFTLVTALKQQGRFDEAAAVLKQHESDSAALDRANRLLREEAKNPTTGPEAPAEVGALLLRIGRDQLGVYWLDQALMRDPNYLPAHQALADYYEKKGDRDRAAQHRGRLNSLAPARKP